MTKILAISGSLRAGSNNTTLLRTAATHAPEGVSVEVLDPAELKALPPYDQDDDTDTPPAAAASLRAKIQAADALLVATPEYNGSIPGQIKNLVDWASRPRGDASLDSKPVGVISSSGSDYGALWGGQELKKSFGIAGARVIEEVNLAVGGVTKKLDNGTVSDQELVGQLESVLEALANKHKALS